MLRRAPPFAQVGRVLFRSTIASDFDNGMAAKVDIAEASDGGGGGVLELGSPSACKQKSNTPPQGRDRSCSRERAKRAGR